MLEVQGGVGWGEGICYRNKISWFCFFLVQVFSKRGQFRVWMGVGLEGRVQKRKRSGEGVEKKREYKRKNRKGRGNEAVVSVSYLEGFL